MKVSLAERRRAPRVPIDFGIKYRILRGKNIQKLEEQSYRIGIAKNMSQYGICMLAPDPLEEGDVIHINFIIRDREIDAFCSIVWSEKEPVGNMYEVGFEFDFLGHYDSLHLLQFMTDMFKKHGMI